MYYRLEMSTAPRDPRVQRGFGKFYRVLAALREFSNLNTAPVRHTVSPLVMSFYNKFFSTEFLKKDILRLSA